MNCTDTKDYIPVRIGNPVRCVVPIEIDGQPADLSGIEKNRLEIWLAESTLISATIRIRPEDITIIGNSLVFTVQSEQQRAPGAYRLFVRYAPVEAGTLGKFTHDVRAIRFVQYSEDVSGSDFRLDIENQEIRINLFFQTIGGDVPDPVYQEKSIKITENGTSVIEADAGFDAISRVDLDVDIPPPSLQDKEVSIDDNGEYEVLPDEEYAGLSGVRLNVNVSKGEDPYFIKSDVWGELALPDELADSTLTVQAFNGKLYIGSGAANKGVWVLDPVAKTCTQILDAVGTWTYFTVYKGELYVATNNSATTYGVCKLNADGTGFTQVMESGAGTLTFLEIGDMTYVSFSTGKVGLYAYVEGLPLAEVYASGYSWDTIYVTERNETFIYSSSTPNYGVIKLNETGVAAALITSTANRTVIKEFEDTIYFASGTSSAQIVFKLNEDRASTSIVTTPQNRSYVGFYEFDGDLFLYGDTTSTSSNASHGGVLKLNADRTAFTALITSNHPFLHFKEAYGNLYVWSAHSSAPGLYKLNADREGFTNILSFSAYALTIWHEYEGEWYVGSAVSSVGIFRIAPDGETVTRLYTVGYGARMYEIAGGLFAMLENTNGILRLNALKTAFASILTSGGVTQDPVWFKGELIIPNGTNIAKITNDGFAVNIGAFALMYNVFEHNDTLYASSTYSGTANRGIVKLNEERTAFAKVFNYGYNYTERVGNRLLSMSGLNSPVFNMNTEEAEEINVPASNAIIVGGWVISPGRFIKIGSEYPGESFFTNSSMITFTPIGDEIGNVFIPTDNNTIIFNTKPL